MPAEERRRGEPVAWSAILSRWRLIEADLASEYGLDLEAEPRLLASRSWRWLETRILGLLAADTRLYRALAPEPEMPEVPKGSRR
ncbi:hypothetical protein ACFFMR_18860 [Micromonospora andamanensis]|uniref:hypothetical protein n=1 Tax=Micromonospora andamanensis TaxID=1287068 RepID=UPI00194F361B|nr:hypothetical protein [Micromonospora andamanensis]